MVWGFITEMFKGMWSGYSLITTGLSFVCALFLLLLPKVNLGKKVERMVKAIKKMPLSYRLLIVLGWLFISVILTSYSMYVDKQTKINDLQKQIEKMSQTPNPKVRAAPIPQNPPHRSPKPTQRLSEPKLSNKQLIAVRKPEPNEPNR